MKKVGVIFQMKKLKTIFLSSHDSRMTLFYLTVILSLYLVGLIFYSFQFSRWGHDGIHHIAALAELYQPFLQGQFDTALSPVLHYGQGLPTFIYYSQWLYMPPFLFTLLGFGLAPAFTLTFVTLTVFAWVGFYKLARYHVSINIAALCATMFTTCNYFLGDIYTRFAYGEFFGYALLPCTIYAIHKALLSQSRLVIVMPIFMFSIILLTYPVMLLNSIPLLVIYCLVILPSKEQFFEFFLKGIIITLVTVSLTAFFWLPGLLEASYILGGDAIGARYSSSFWTLDSAVLNFLDQKSLGVFLNIALLLAICVHLFLLRHLHKAYALLTIIVFYIFMATKPSTVVWELIPILQANIFATKLIIPLSFISCLYVACVFQAFNQKLITKVITVTLCLIMLTQGSLLIYRYTGELERDPQTFAQVFPSDINTQLEYRLKFYKTLTEGPGAAEFRPNIDLPLPGPRVSVLDCQEKVQLPSYVKDLQRENIVISYDFDKAGCFIQLPVFWNVRYRAIDDHDEQLITGYNDNGVLMVKTANKSGEITVRFTDPNYVRWSKYISVFTLMLSVFSMLVLVCWHRKKVKE